MGLKIATCVRTTARDEDSARNSKTPNRMFSNELLEDPVTPNRVFSSGVLKDSETPNRLFSDELLEDSEAPKNHDEVLEDLVSPNLLSLPNEILVKIMLYLPDTHDRVKFRYVSRRLRSISEIPSLLYGFVWPDCYWHEERCLYNVMKDCGVHIRRLSFPQQLIHPRRLPNTESQAIPKLMQMAEMLQFCSNLTHLSLPALDYSNSIFDNLDEQLRRGIQEMKHLEVLTIHCYTSVKPYLSLKTALKELTIYTVIRSKESVVVFIDWMMNGFNPPKLNIILHSSSINVTLRTFGGVLMSVWSRWNSQIPAGHFACLKVYIDYKVPLNLFQNAPVFQLQYGERLTLPLARVDIVGTSKWLLLTDHDINDSRVVLKANYKQYNYRGTQGYVLLHNIATSLTELDLSECNFNLVQVIVSCPLLQRLNIKNNSALSLQDLRTIANCCCVLEGLNLTDVPIPRTESSLIDLWEILSSMRKLAYLSIDTAYLVSPLQMEVKLSNSLRRCRRLQALELSNASFAMHTRFEIDTRIDNYKMLSYFPSLEYCRVISSLEYFCVVNILTACKRLKYFYCHCSVQESLLPQAHVSNLQQLCISSELSDLDDRFMEAVSVHGGLVHVVFLVNSVTFNGIITLIQNSPNLLTCLLGLYEQKIDCNWLNTELAKMFDHRKLFISGLSLVQQAKPGRLVKGVEWLQNTDLLTLWPLKNFIESDFPF